MKCPCCECEMISEMFDGDEGKRTESECPECGCTVNSTKIEVEKALKRFNSTYDAILKKLGEDIGRACIGNVGNKPDAEEKKLPDAVREVRDSIETRIKRINIKDGDVLLVKSSSPTMISKESRFNLRKAIDNAGYKNVLLIHVVENDDLTKLDDRAMEFNGWIRKDKVAKMCDDINRTVNEMREFGCEDCSKKIKRAMSWWGIGG